MSSKAAASFCLISHQHSNFIKSQKQEETNDYYKSHDVIQPWIPIYFYNFCFYND